MWPPSCRWLESLLEAKFFDTCVMHAGIKKSERNYYCLNCRHSNICQHCLPNHATHELLQVRRYVYHDVVRVQDVEMYLDCKSIQTYIINGANVVFLNDRPQTKPVKAALKACETCSRSLQDHYRFCSLACKITALASNRAGPVGRVLKRKAVELREAEGGDDCASGAQQTAWAPTPPVDTGVEAPCINRIKVPSLLSLLDLLALPKILKLPALPNLLVGTSRWRVQGSPQASSRSVFVQD
jgi:hypothetical protein